MKTPTIKNKYIIHFSNLLLFISLWICWYFKFFHTMIWMEGFSYFSTLPDFTFLQVNFPDDIFIYIGAYFLQFFQNPIYGATIQAGFATFIILCIEVSLFKIFKNHSIVWLAYVLLPFFIQSQYEDITLERSIKWCLIVLAIMSICFMLKIRVKDTFIPKRLKSPIFIIGIPTLTIISSLRILTNKDTYQEQLCQIDYLANQNEWGKILDIISPKDAQKDALKLRYALLALSETGQLADHMFKYGISDYSQFLFYGNEDPFERSFNALFYRSLNMPNEIIHQSFQQSLTSPLGFNFKSLRLLTDTYLNNGNYKLASKNIEILKHSSLHDKWIKQRLPILDSLKVATSEQSVENSPAFVGNFLETITSLVNQDFTNKKIIDLCLCGALTTKNIEYFYQSFEVIAPIYYAKGERIPRYYEEALLLISLQDKYIMKRYNISIDAQKRFYDFMTNYQQGKFNLAKSKHSDSFWSYIF